MRVVWWWRVWGVWMVSVIFLLLFTVCFIVWLGCSCFWLLLVQFGMCSMVVLADGEPYILFLSLKHGVRVVTQPNTTVEHVLLALGEQVGHRNISFASRMNKKRWLYLWRNISRCYWWLCGSVDETDGSQSASRAACVHRTVVLVALCFKKMQRGRWRLNSWLVQGRVKMCRVLL